MPLLQKPLTPDTLPPTMWLLCRQQKAGLQSTSRRALHATHHHIEPTAVNRYLGHHIHTVPLSHPTERRKRRADGLGSPEPSAQTPCIAPPPETRLRRVVRRPARAERPPLPSAGHSTRRLAHCPLSAHCLCPHGLDDPALQPPPSSCPQPKPAATAPGANCPPPALQPSSTLLPCSRGGTSATSVPPSASQPIIIPRAAASIKQPVGCASTLSTITSHPASASARHVPNGTRRFTDGPSLSPLPDPLPCLVSPTAMAPATTLRRVVYPHLP